MKNKALLEDAYKLWTPTRVAKKAVKVVAKRTSAPLEDSGKREKYEGGGMREPRTGKGRFDLIPPYALLRLAQHFDHGAQKYAERNWEKGLPLSRYLNSALSHLYAFMDGKRSEDHLAAALWNISCYVHTEREIAAGRLPKEFRDVPWPDSVGREV